MRDPAYAAFSALDPFFDIVRQGLAGLVDGDHYFDTIAPDAVFEFRYRFPGYPTKVVGREALMALYAGYGEGMALHGADALVVNISQTPGVVILEYEVQGNAVGSGKLYGRREITTQGSACVPRRAATVMRTRLNWHSGAKIGEVIFSHIFTSSNGKHYEKTVKRIKGLAHRHRRKGLQSTSSSGWLDNDRLVESD